MKAASSAPSLGVPLAPTLKPLKKAYWNKYTLWSWVRLPGLFVWNVLLGLEVLPNFFGDPSVLTTCLSLSLLSRLKPSPLLLTTCFTSTALTYRLLIGTILQRIVWNFDGPFGKLTSPQIGSSKTSLFLLSPFLLHLFTTFKVPFKLLCYVPLQTPTCSIPLPITARPFPSSPASHLPMVTRALGPLPPLGALDGLGDPQKAPPEGIKADWKQTGDFIQIAP